MEEAWVPFSECPFKAVHAIRKLLTWRSFWESDAIPCVACHASYLVLGVFCCPSSLYMDILENSNSLNVSLCGNGKSQRIGPYKHGVPVLSQMIAR